jgi:hypothetical protein
MRNMIIAIAAAAATLLPATAVSAQGYGYNGYHGRNSVQRERRECRRELRRADDRREFRRELRECRREISRARRHSHRGYDRYDRDDRRW